MDWPNRGFGKSLPEKASRHLPSRLALIALILFPHPPGGQSRPLGGHGRTTSSSRPRAAHPSGPAGLSPPRPGACLARFRSLCLPIRQGQPHLDLSCLLVDARCKGPCVLSQKGLNVVVAVNDGSGELAMRALANDEECPDAGEHQLIQFVPFPADVLIVRQGHPAAIANETQPCGVWNVVESKVPCVGLDSEPGCCKLCSNGWSQISVGKECELRRLVRRGSPRQFQDPLGRNRERHPLCSPQRRAVRRWSRCALPFRLYTADRKKSAGR